MLGEQRDDKQLSDQAWLAALHEVPGSPSPTRAGRAQLERPHEAKAAHLSHQLVALHERAGQLEQPLPHGRGAIDQRGVVELTQGGQRRRGGQVVLREGRAMDNGALHAVEDAIEDVPRREHRANRHVAAGQRLGEHDDVRAQLPVLERQEAAGATEPGLDLVEREQRAVPSA